MKVIHVAGFSNTGKTTFITELIPELEKLGTVGVVKHIGHHGSTLPEGKDTTRFFASGAITSAGIEEEKSILITKEQNLEQVLRTFSDAGIAYAIIEGFKERTYPKIVIGDVPSAGQVVLQDPSVSDVLAHLGEFLDLLTPEGFLKSLRRDCPPGMITLLTTIESEGHIRKETLSTRREELQAVLKERGDIRVTLGTSGAIERGTRHLIMIGIWAPEPVIAGEAVGVATRHLLPLIRGESER